MAFDLSLGRRGRFADESALFWPVWGARMLAAPLVRSASSRALRPGPPVARWGLRRAGFGRSGSSPLDRLMAASTNELAVLVLLVSILAVNAFFFRFQDGIAAINDLVDDSTSVSVAWMRPDNFDEHNAYRFLAFLVCAGSTLAWLSLARRRRALLQAPTVLLPILGGLVLAVAMGLWALPYSAAVPGRARTGAPGRRDLLRGRTPGVLICCSSARRATRHARVS